MVGSPAPVPNVAKSVVKNICGGYSWLATFGTGAGDPTIQPWLAPAYIVNDAVSMTRGKHTISFGGELRFAQNSAIFLGGQSGSFDFQRGETGLQNVVSGSPIASFLLEQVDTSSTNFYTS